MSADQNHMETNSISFHGKYYPANLHGFLWHFSPPPLTACPNCTFPGWGKVASHTCAASLPLYVNSIVKPLCTDRWELSYCTVNCIVDCVPITLFVYM
ncbi:hypothetical protein XELAEV_18026422mg [Xenopus laevis]|uniref:Uncharacterized protein n=1 Tax=Xenopus laevis TaxID=8355 RepID=A0A974CTR0_XENLA|nr:hypothetical protein XELAEV_18026422mg [Xenopus laevis]